VSLVAIAAAGRAFSFYAWAGEDDDVGALSGSRADERQKLISLRSRAVAWNTAACPGGVSARARCVLRLSGPAQRSGPRVIGTVVPDRSQVAANAGPLSALTVSSEMKPPVFSGLTMKIG